VPAVSPPPTGRKKGRRSRGGEGLLFCWEGGRFTELAFGGTLPQAGRYLFFTFRHAAHSQDPSMAQGCIIDFYTRVRDSNLSPISYQAYCMTGKRLFRDIYSREGMTLFEPLAMLYQRA